MDNKAALEMRIQILRSLLYALIEKSNDLLDPDVIDVSRELDLLLNEYLEKTLSRCTK